VGEESDVQVWRRPPLADLAAAGGALDVIKGRGVVNAAPQDVLGVLEQHERRKWYDPMLQASRQVEAFGTLRVLHLRFQAQGGFCRVASRDFVIASDWRKLEGGGFALVGVSVQHPQAPPAEDCVRGLVLVGGWVIRPLPDAPHRSRVTYLVCLDPQGYIPTWAVNKAMAEQPMCIQRLRGLFL
jgi:hypothetical protein